MFSIVCKKSYVSSVVYFHEHFASLCNAPYLLLTMAPCSDDVRLMTGESLAPFHRNRRRLTREQRQYESSSKVNRQLVKRDPPLSSGGTDLQISSPNTFTRNGSKLNNYEARNSSKPNFSSFLMILSIFFVYCFLSITTIAPPLSA
ncbi:unnamed protein product [Protopolystoma xenopodis]|uniref:Uncharacterized protein n=1 Tax=Protopolystoma xenopodis TaxID=117903 RepID=A0A3S5BLM1_9PLAT|nr:unnamed protein product [Protopolystoma xenopodis]